MPNKNTPPYLSMSPFPEDEYVRAVRRLGGVFRNNFNFSHLDDHIKTYEFKICTGCNSVGEGLSEIMKWSIPHYFPEYGFTHIRERENARGVNTAAWEAVDSHERTCHFNFGIETDENTGTSNIILIDASLEDQYIETVERLDGIWYTHFNIMEIGIHTEFENFEMCSGCHYDQWLLADVMKWSIPHYFPQYGFVNITERDAGVPDGANAAWVAVDRNNERCQFNFYVETISSTNKTTITLVSAGYSLGPEFDGEIEHDQEIEGHHRENIHDSEGHHHENIHDVDGHHNTSEPHMREPNDGSEDEFEKAVNTLGGTVAENEPLGELERYKSYNMTVCTGCNDDEEGLAKIMKWSIPHYFPQYNFTNLFYRPYDPDYVPDDANAAVLVAIDFSDMFFGQFNFRVEKDNTTHKTIIILVSTGCPPIPGYIEGDQDDSDNEEESTGEHDIEGDQDDSDDEEESMEEHEQRLRAPRDEYERAVGEGHVSEVRPVNMELFHNVCLCTQVNNMQEKVNSVIKWSIPHYFPTYGFTHMTEHHDVREDISRCWTAQSADGKLWVFCFHVKHDDDAGEADVYLVDAHCLGRIVGISR